MKLFEQWIGVALGLVLLVVLLQSAMHEAARGPRADNTAAQDANVVGRRDIVRLAVLMVLVLATLGPRLFSLLV